MNAKSQSDIRRKLRVLNYAKQIGNIAQACRYYGISRETYYQWKRAYEAGGEVALINNSKPCPQNLKLRTPEHIEKLILHLRQTYHRVSSASSGTWSDTTISKYQKARFTTY